jgi:hypothetical protein
MKSENPLRPELPGVQNYGIAAWTMVGGLGNQKDPYNADVGHCWQSHQVMRRSS